MKRPILLILVLLIVILLLDYSVPATPTLAPELQQRLDLLVEQLEQQRQTLHVPGMAIAVVKDDELILTHGFGVASVETETPVTPETIFAIGSSTKAFTSTLVGMLVDEGKMDWDDPVTEYYTARCTFPPYWLYPYEPALCQRPNPSRRSLA